MIINKVISKINFWPKLSREIRLSVLFAFIIALGLLFGNEIFAASKQNNTADEQLLDNGKRIWNLDNVDILALIGEVSRVTGRNFVIDPRVKGTASLVSNEPMDNKQAYAAFLSILQVLGYATVESGPITKIIPSSVAKSYDTKVNIKDLSKLGDEMVVQVIPVKHVTASALIPILRNLVNQQGMIAPYTPSNIIVVADHASNVKRITEIINRIDQESSDDVEIIRLKDASAEEVVKTLNNLLQRGQGLGEPVTQQIKLAADIRTNSILLSGDKGKRLKVRAVIAQMDVPTPNTGDTEVIYLQFQNAGDLVPVVSTIIESYYEKLKGSRQAPSTSTSRSSAGGSVRASDTSSSSSSDGISSSFNLEAERRGEGETLSAPGVRAEPNTNALIITAPQELMRSIKSVISKLDIRRYQVLVEALIVEVQLEHNLDLGVEWRLPHFNDGFGGGTNFGDPNSNTATAGLINSAYSTATSLSSLPLRSIPLSGMTIGFLRGGDIRAIVHSLAQDINTNILSTPSLVTMDNETAEIVVADNIPFQTGSITNAASDTGNITNSFEYKDVGLKLKITPMITKGDAIKLTIEQETGNVRTPGVTPTTAKRTIKTVVSVDDKDILVLGGLIQGQKDAGESKIPIIGDIPIIGNIFKRSDERLTKRNLMVFIRPVVLRTQDQSYNVSLSKYDLMRDSQLLYKVDPSGKIAKDLMNELPDLNKKIPAEQKKLNLPEPFDTTTIISDVLESKLLQ